MSKIEKHAVPEYSRSDGEADYLGWCVNEERRRHGDLSYAVIGALMKVHRELVDHNLHTYSLGTLNRLFGVEARHQHLACSKLLVQPTCRERELPAREVNAWRTGDQTLVYLSASPEGLAKQNRAVLHAYLEQSGIAQGILVNFGSSAITVCPIPPPSQH